MSKLSELKAIAEAFCKKFGYTFIFANDYKFGYETKDGQFWTLYYTELEEILKGSKNNDEIPQQEHN